MKEVEVLPTLDVFFFPCFLKGKTEFLHINYNTLQDMIQCSNKTFIPNT